MPAWVKSTPLLEYGIAEDAQLNHKISSTLLPVSLCVPNTTLSYAARAFAFYSFCSGLVLSCLFNGCGHCYKYYCLYCDAENDLIRNSVLHSV